MNQNSDETVDFGFEQVSKKEKTERVEQVFTSVARKYDQMNDLMSLGIHRAWKKTLILLSQVRAGQKILDLAGGTGDLTSKFSKKVGPSGHVVLADINLDMLKVGRDRLINEGLIGNLHYTRLNAESLPFADNYFDCITLAFGLRNMTNKAQALLEAQRTIKPGGKLMILEFSKPINPTIAKIYDAYSFAVLPRLGQLIANDGDSYRYLVESIRMHPDQNTLKEMILSAGFDHCQVHNFSAGIVALHIAWKY